jgi:hypothetical protein
MERNHLLPVPLGLVRWALCEALNVLSLAEHLRPFARLDLERRTEVLSKIGKIQGMPLLLSLIRAPFYTGTVNQRGFEYLGYPGENRGYADFSFDEVTWVSHPRVVGGNLP